MSLEEKVLQRRLQQKIIPKSKSSKKKIKVKDDLPFFGMRKFDKTSVEDIMRQLRGGRYTDI